MDYILYLKMLLTILHSTCEQIYLSFGNTTPVYSQISYHHGTNMCHQMACIGGCTANSVRLCEQTQDALFCLENVTKNSVILYGNCNMQHRLIMAYSNLERGDNNNNIWNILEDYSAEFIITVLRKQN